MSGKTQSYHASDQLGSVCVYECVCVCVCVCVHVCWCVCARACVYTYLEKLSCATHQANLKFWKLSTHAFAPPERQSDWYSIVWIYTHVCITRLKKCMCLGFQDRVWFWKIGSIHIVYRLSVMHHLQEFKNKHWQIRKSGVEIKYFARW